MSGNECELRVVERATQVGLRPSEWLALSPTTAEAGSGLTGMDPDEWREAMLSTVEQYD